MVAGSCSNSSLVDLSSTRYGMSLVQQRGQRQERGCEQHVVLCSSIRGGLIINCIVCCGLSMLRQSRRSSRFLYNSQARARFPLVNRRQSSSDQPNVIANGNPVL